MKRQWMVWLLLVGLLAPLVLPQPAVAQTGNQWQILYFPNPNWSGPAVYTQYVSVLNINWGGASPAPNVPAQNFTATIDTDMFFYAGLYTFTLLADDEISLAIGNTTFFSSMGTNQPGKSFTVNVPITQQGTQHITIYYRQASGPSYINVSWTYQKGGGGGGAPPSPTPAPPSGNNPPPTQSLVTKYGDYTPCMQQNIHQSNCFKSDGAWNSPNLGSIQMEPQIVLWQLCTADQVTTQRVPPNQSNVSTRCSRTEAGWFPN
jgi:hypothetical protein